MFCLDTSGSMYEHLSLITAQLGQVRAVHAPTTEILYASEMSSIRSGAPTTDIHALLVL